MAKLTPVAAGADEDAMFIPGSPESAWAAFSAKPKISIVDAGLFTALFIALLVPYMALVVGSVEEKWLAVPYPCMVETADG